MRYQQLGTFSYTDGNGNSHILREFEPINRDQEIKKTIIIDKHIFAMAKKEFSTESDWYKIFDANAQAIMENKFTLEGLKKLKIPQ